MEWIGGSTPRTVCVANWGSKSLADVPVCGNRSFMSASSAKSSLAASNALLPLRFALDMSYSHFSEALRSIKSSVDAVFPANESIVVGTAPVGASEGKATIATHLAQLYRNEGTSVLLVDADFLSAQLSRVATESGVDFGMEPLQLHAASLKYIGCLCSQRNNILDNIEGADVVLFLEDDFLMVQPISRNRSVVPRTSRYHHVHGHRPGGWHHRIRYFGSGWDEAGRG